ncbi:MAG TPA: hypothetical protein VIG71_10805 [Enteractinococcus sp.]
MRKTLGILGIAALTLTGCGSATEEQSDIQISPVANDTTKQDEAIRLFGAIVFEGDKAVLMGEDKQNCMIAEPTTTVVMNHLESAEVFIEDDRGEVVATTEFHTFHNEERCSWLIDVEVESGSEYFVAHFNDMQTPKAFASDYEQDYLELDVTTPVSEEIESR